MKKLFISQPMNGLTKEEITQAREVAVEVAMERINDEIEIIDTVFEDFEGSTNPPLKFLSRALDKLAEADVAYFGKGWENTRGCKIEHECAIQYGIPVLHYQ